MCRDGDRGTTPISPSSPCPSTHPTGWHPMGDQELLEMGPATSMWTSAGEAPSKWRLSREGSFLALISYEDENLSSPTRAAACSGAAQRSSHPIHGVHASHLITGTKSRWPRPPGAALHRGAAEQLLAACSDTVLQLDLMILEVLSSLND